MDNFSLFDLFGWNWWGRSYAGDTWLTRLETFPFILGIGLIPAVVQSIAAGLLTLAIPNRFMPKSRWLPHSKYALVTFSMVLIPIAYVTFASRIFVAGECLSLEQLYIDDIDWAYQCAKLNRTTSDTLNDAMRIIALFSFGWPWLLFQAGIFEWGVRRTTPR